MFLTLARAFGVVGRDARSVTTDTHNLYFGTELNDRRLTPGDKPSVGPTRFEDWVSRSVG
jgi:hypothetical protein